MQRQWACGFVLTGNSEVTLGQGERGKRTFRIRAYEDCPEPLSTDSEKLRRGWANPVG